MLNKTDKVVGGEEPTLMDFPLPLKDLAVRSLRLFTPLEPTGWKQKAVKEATESKCLENEKENMKARS